jgi:hypothetical protein
MRMQLVSKMCWSALVVVASLTPASGCCQAYNYTNPVAPNSTVTLQLTPAMVSGGGRGGGAIYCSKRDDYVCVASDDLNFAVPISTKLPLQHWQYKGYAYEVVSRRNLELLGKSIAVSVIESDQNGMKFRFVYSTRQGLLAFSIFMSGENHLFLSQTAIGFGGQ